LALAGGRDQDDQQGGDGEQAEFESHAAYTTADIGQYPS
jgi:hypothetical protein